MARSVRVDSPLTESSDGKELSRFRRLQRRQLILLAVMGCALIGVAAFSSFALVSAANTQTAAASMYDDLVKLREAGRVVQLEETSASAGGTLTPHAGIGMARLTQRVRTLATRQEGLDAPEQARIAARNAVGGAERAEEIFARYMVAPDEHSRKRVMPEGFAIARSMGADLGLWVEAWSQETARASAAMRATAIRQSIIFTALVTVVMVLGFVVWFGLERVRDRLVTHLNATRHEQAGLRRVAELVAAEQPSRTVLSALAQEMVAVSGADTGWVLQVEGRRCSVRGGTPPDGGLPQEIGEIREFTAKRDGVLQRVLDTRRPARWRSGDRGLAPSLEELDVRSVVAAPIVASGRLWGAVLIFSGDPDRFGASSEDVLVPFARLAGLAITGQEGRQALTERASVDALTGLANHGVFHERLAEEVARARDTGQPVSLVMIDVDRLSDVNERHGHREGDRVLAGIARRLEAITPAEGLVARVGGEEFALVLPDTAIDLAMRIAERARHVVSTTSVTPRSQVTVSSGVCSTELAGDASALFDSADAALLVAKADGRNCVVKFNPEFLTREARRQRLRRAERARTLAAVQALARALDARDPATRLHSERVATTTYRIACEMGWPADRAELLREVALVHDVGKIGVPDAVLRKPGRLTEEEFAQIATHSSLGATIVADILTAEQTGWVRHHHERIDGTGYPDGLAGDQVPEGAQILALTDSWDAMTTDRPYRRALSVEEAVRECRAGAGTQFAQRVVDVGLPILVEAARTHVKNSALPTV